MPEIKPVLLKKNFHDNKDDDEPELLGEIMEAVENIADMNINVPHLTSAMLNVDQKEFSIKLRVILSVKKKPEDLLENDYLD